MEKYIPKEFPESASKYDRVGFGINYLLKHLGINSIIKNLDNYEHFELVIRDVALGFEAKIKEYKDGLYVLIGKDNVSINVSKKEYSVAELNIIKKKIDKLIFDVKNGVLRNLGDFIEEELKKHIPVDYTYTRVNLPNSLAIGVKIKHWEDITYQWEINKKFETLVKLDLGPPKSCLYRLATPSLLQDLVRVQYIFMTSVIYFKNKTNTYGSNN